MNKVKQKYISFEDLQKRVNTSITYWTIWFEKYKTFDLPPMILCYPPKIILHNLIHVHICMHIKTLCIKVVYWPIGSLSGLHLVHVISMNIHNYNVLVFHPLHLIKYMYIHINIWAVTWQAESITIIYDTTDVQNYN